MIRKGCPNEAAFIQHIGISGALTAQEFIIELFAKD
jgi:hypothetical protein